MENNKMLYNYILRLADDNLIFAQRMAEWCSCGPILEEDLALVNVSLDMFGQSESFYEYAAEIAADGSTADSLAFGRSERNYFNHLLVEQPNGDFAMTMVKMALFSAFMRDQYLALSKSKDERIAAISAKALKESRYHFRHASEWLVRLGNSTKESASRLDFAINELYSFVGDLFMEDEISKQMAAEGIGANMKELESGWSRTVEALMENANITAPKSVHMITGGILGVHTEHLGHLLCEMQYLHHAHPGAKW